MVINVGIQGDYIQPVKFSYLDSWKSQPSQVCMMYKSAEKTIVLDMLLFIIYMFTSILALSAHVTFKCV